MNYIEKLDLTLKNLQKVYDELPALAEKIPAIRTDFDICHFGVYWAQTKQFVLTNDCGTTGCLLGNAARLFDLQNNAYYHHVGARLEFSYMHFGSTIFPALYRAYKDGTPNMWQPNDMWDYLFSEHWAHTQPTFDQAIARLKYFLEVKGDVGEEGVDWFFRPEVEDY